MILRVYILQRVYRNMGLWIFRFLHTLLPLCVGLNINSVTINNQKVFYRVIYGSKLRCNMSVFINKVISLFSSVNKGGTLSKMQIKYKWLYFFLVYWTLVIWIFAWKMRVFLVGSFDARFLGRGVGWTDSPFPTLKSEKYYVNLPDTLAPIPSKLLHKPRYTTQ